jgi:hypothetical protein
MMRSISGTATCNRELSSSAALLKSFKDEEYFHFLTTGGERCRMVSGRIVASPYACAHAENGIVAANAGYPQPDHVLRRLRLEFRVLVRSPVISFKF